MPGRHRQKLLSALLANGRRVRRSAFNHLAALPEGGFALYNFLTGRCLRLSVLSRDYYDNFELYGSDCAPVRRLVERGFLVDYDEHAYLRSRVCLECGDTRKLRLTVCPTLQCNFACPYCYETARGGRMGERVQDDLVAFAEATLERYRAGALDVCWYGGEPLLEPGVIRDLSGRLMSLCDERGIPYWASVITNGYFLDAPMAALLDECRIGSIQVTLDGPNARTHDATRHLRSGGGTFDRIMSNIATFPGKCDITVRCNVHKGNAGEYPQLEKRLLALGKEGDRQISAYAGHMDGHGPYEGMAMHAVEYADFRRATDKDVDRVGYVGPTCMAPKLLDLVVDERGNLYKCLESVGRDGESFGNISDFDFTDPQSGNMDVLSEWLGYAWPDDEECLQCPLLPICLGGCPQRRREGAKECTPIKQLTDEYVIALARKLMHRDEG